MRRRLMLRTRFTIAVAIAVAAITLVITAVAFLVVRSDLQNQSREVLVEQSAAVHRLARHYHGHIPAGWVPPHSDRFGTSTPYTQVVTAQGAVWAPPGDAGLLAAGTAVQVAAGKRAAYYSQATLDGVHAMVLTTPLAPGLALQQAVPLNTVDLDVTIVGATLALLSAVGVVLAALVGWGVARAGLTPVARLAAVAEQVTATGNPAQRVAVDRADELGRLATSFNTMLAALQRSLAAQRQLVSDASHELRTPLTSLRINVELLAKDSGLAEAERQEVLDRVVIQVAELGDLVASVTELARGELARGELARGELATGAPGRVRLDEVAAAALEGARRDWPRTVFTADLQPGTVFGSAERLQIAVRNLVDNAAKFGPPGGPVELSLRAGQLTVRDYGPGIDAADLPYVFDRFYRASSARAVPGSGLGLSITRQVAESHHGTIRAERAPGGGTLMRLSLPETASLPEAATPLEAATPPEAASLPEETSPPEPSGPPAAGTAPAAGREYLSRR